MPTPLLIGDLIRRNAKTHPLRVAAWMNGISLTFAELDEAADRVGHALRNQGVAHGDRVVTWADTGLEVLPLFVALARLGAVFAPLNARLGQAEAIPIVEMAQPRMLVADAGHLEGAMEVARTLGIQRVGSFSAPDSGDEVIDLRSGSLAPSPTLIDEPALSETDPHVIFFTSGSTGAPKGVVLSHRANYLRSYQGVFLAEHERSVCMFPLFHMAAFTLALSAWQTQGEIAFVREATAEQILEAAEARKANRLYCIPAVWNRILAVGVDRFDTSSLRFIDTGTSATPIELLKALKDRFPESVLRIYYGSTEAGAGTTLMDADVLAKPGSVGLPSPGVDLRIGEGGEICLRTHYLMDGYFNNPEATREALQEGWYHTGDIGVLDEEGFLSVIGRMKDLIRTGGEGVAPTEVEAALSTHPGIRELAVVGIPDPQWGEVICAVVVPEEGVSITLEALQETSGEVLAGFKKPRRLELVSALPRTSATGQVQRLLLVEQITARGPI